MLKGHQSTTNNYLIKQLPTATAFINKKFEVVHASDKWMTEHNLEPGDVFGKRIDTLFTKLSDQWESTLQECLTGKVDEICVDDTTTDSYFEWYCNPWFDEKENIIGLVIRTEDVTKQKQQERNFAKLESIVKITSQVAKIGTWEYDVIEDKVHWCGITHKIHEVPEDFKPTIDSAVDFYKDGYSKNTIAMVVHEAITNGKPWSEKLQLITAKGNEIWVQASGMPVFEEGKLMALTGTFQDIDHRVRSEAKTRENERLLRTLVDNLPLNIYVKDSESRKILINKAECNYLGIKDPKKVLGKSNDDLYDPDIAEILNKEDVAVMETLRSIIAKETNIRTKEGKTTTFLVSKIPLLDEQGKAYGLIGISHDISDLKRKEEELRNLINVTSRQNKKLVDFAHIVSHNLRSHTANFSMLLELLVNEGDESEKKKIIAMLTDASDNLLETLENLNQVVDINANINQKKKLINLNAVICDIEKNLSPFLLNNNATLVNRVSNEIEINVVASYIDSILMNFIINAVKYKNPEVNPIVILSAKREGGYTILSIADNGLGINLEKYGDKLFGMYKTFHNHTEARGIGLYITKNQIDAMNGKIEVTSEVGKGTTFNIYFNEGN